MPLKKFTLYVYAAFVLLSSTKQYTLESDHTSCFPYHEQSPSFDDWLSLAQTSLLINTLLLDNLIWSRRFTIQLGRHVLFHGALVVAKCYILLHFAAFVLSIFRSRLYSILPSRFFTSPGVEPLRAMSIFTCFWAIPELTLFKMASS